MISKNSEVVQQTEVLRSKISTYLRSKGINVNSPFNCLNPAHDDHSHCMKYNPNTLTVYCSKCQAYYDIFDLVGHDFGLNYKESREKVASLYNIPLVSSREQRPSPADLATRRVTPVALPPREAPQRQGYAHPDYVAPPLPLGDIQQASQQNQPARYLSDDDPIYQQDTSVAEATAATGLHQAMSQEDINRRCSEIWGESEPVKKPIEGPVLAPEDDFVNPYVVGNKAQGNKRMVLSNPTAPSTLINGCAFNDRQLSKVKSDITAASRREEAVRNTRSLSALVADAQSQNARRDPFAPFNGNTSTIISTGSNKPSSDSADLNFSSLHNTTTILSDKRPPETPSLIMGGSDRKTNISTSQHSSANSSFNFSFDGHKSSPNTIASGERHTPEVDFTKIDDDSQQSKKADKTVLSFVDETATENQASAKKEQNKDHDFTDFGIELVTAEALKKKSSELQPEDLKAKDPAKKDLLKELAQQKTQLDLDLAAVKKKTAKEKQTEVENKPHDPNFTLADDDISEDLAPQSKPAPSPAPSASTPASPAPSPAEPAETEVKTVISTSPAPAEPEAAPAVPEKKTEITKTPVKPAIKMPEPLLENDPIIPVAAAAAQIANEQAAEQAAERASRLFITSTLDEAQSMANLGFAAIALNQADQSSVLIEQLKIYNNKYTCFICLQPTEEWQECAQQLEQELDEAEQDWEELDLISPYVDITEALQNDRDLFITRLQNLDPPLTQELLRVVAPMKNTGFIGSTDSLAALRPAHLLYTMVAPNTNVSRMVLSGLIALKKEILFAGSKMQWQMLCNRLSDNAAVIFENPNKDTSINTRVVSQANREAAIKALDLQSYHARLVEMPLELDSRSILLSLTQAIMDIRNNEDSDLQNPVLMIDTFSFEDKLCAAIAPLLAELALGLSIPLMVWCSSKQRGFFEGQSVQTIDLSLTSDNSIQFKTMDHNCRPFSFCSAPGFKA